jgi:uncharacterized protein involved in exopolysaccharide biosynthesis
MDQPKEIQVNDDEISLKDLILVVRTLWGEFWRKKWTLIPMAIIGSMLGFSVAFFTTPYYKASYRFFVKEGSASGLGGSLGSLGSLLGGGGGTLLDKSVEVIKSEMVVGKVLLTPIEVEDKSDLVINHYINLQDLKKQWEEDTLLIKAKFALADTIPETYNPAQRKAYKFILTNFINEKSTIIQHSFEKKSGVISLSVNNKNEDFSVKVSGLILEGVRSFIRNYAAESLNNNVEVLTKKVDSIQGELNSVRRRLARATDQSFSIFLNEDKVDLKALAVQEQILLTMYAEAQKNLETVLFMGQSASNSPAVIVLDHPYSPIKPEQKSILIYSIAGFILAGGFGFGFILIRRWYKNLMAT